MKCPKCGSEMKSEKGLLGNKMTCTNKSCGYSMQVKEDGSPE